MLFVILVSSVISQDQQLIDRCLEFVKYYYFMVLSVKDNPFSNRLPVEMLHIQGKYQTVDYREYSIPCYTC